MDIAAGSLYTRATRLYGPTARSWCRSPKALGRGAGVEDEVVVLQGDQRDRAAQLLEGDGWRVVRG